MQQAIKPEPIDIERIRSKLTCELMKFLLHSLWYTNIKNAFHQYLDGKQVGVDALQIAECLSQAVSLRRGWRGWTSSSWLGRSY